MRARPGLVSRRVGSMVVLAAFASLVGVACGDADGAAAGCGDWPDQIGVAVPASPAPPNGDSPEPAGWVRADEVPGNECVVVDVEELASSEGVLAGFAAGRIHLGVLDASSFVGGLELDFPIAVVGIEGSRSGGAANANANANANGNGNRSASAGAAPVERRLLVASRDMVADHPEAVAAWLGALDEALGDEALGDEGPSTQEEAGWFQLAGVDQLHIDHLGTSERRGALVGELEAIAEQRRRDAERTFAVSTSRLAAAIDPGPLERALGR